MRFLVNVFLMTLFLVSGIGNHLQAQRYFTKTYTEADGLSSSMVFDVAQDSAGQIWFATRTGISNYTGIRFINYNLSNGLRTFTYAFLAVDQQGALWALPQTGELCVLKFSGTGWETIFCDTTLKQEPYYTTFDVFSQGNQVVVAVGTNQSGLLLCRDGIWTQYKTNEGAENDRINGIAGTGNAIYIATGKGLSVIRKGTISGENEIQEPYFKKNILALYAAPSSLNRADTVIWLLGENWLGMLSDGLFQLVSSDFDLPAKDIGNRCFLRVSNNGDVCFGNPIYVYFYTERSGKTVKLDRTNGLITNGGTAALTDREGNLWITGFRGITKIPSMRFQQFSEQNGLYSNEVASAIEISPGHYVFGHHGAITFYDGKSFSSLKLLNPSGKGEFETRVQDLDVDPAGNLWMAVSENGIARLTRDRHLTWFGTPDGLSGKANSVLVTSEGFVYAGLDDGLFLFKNGRFEEQAVGNEIVSNGVRKIFQGPRNDLYLASFTRGIIRMSGDSIVSISSPDNPLANNVYSIFFDKQNKGWVGTAAGLYAISDTVLIKVDTGGLVINRPTYLILQDHHGCLWFGTDNGASRWNGERLDQFTIREGFSGLEVNRDAGFQDHENNIWFGTNNGLTKFNPEYDYELNNIPPPIVKLGFIFIEGDTLNPFENRSLASERNSLTFQFSITSYLDEKQVFYQCKLEGFDEEWSRDLFYHNTEYSYDNLPPGTYRFCIKARNSIGIWSDPQCSATIRIRQPVWFQWWFILLVMAFIFSLLFILTRLFVTRRYNLRLSKMVAIRTRAFRQSEKDLQESNESKDNFFSIIAHDLKSPFNAMLGMLELLTTEYSDFTDAERKKILMSLKMASTRTIDLLENLLTWAQSQKGLLPFVPVKFDLMELVRENVSLFEPTARTKRIKLIATLSDNVVVYGDRNMINTVIRNLISNAIKFTYPDGDVTITVDRGSGRKVTVAVIDNGCGISETAIKNLFILDKRISTKGTGNESGTGLGLILSKDFIAKNKGEIWVESKPEAGSTFYFTLPVDPPGNQNGKNDQ